jgi:hypothetical protein
MNDRESLIHIITSLLNYKKYSALTSDKLDNKGLNFLLHSYKIALFPHVSDDFVKEMFHEVIEADNRLVNLGNKMEQYYDETEEVQR